MADSNCYLAFFLLAAVTVFLHQPRVTSGLHSPLNLKAEAVNGSNLLIISWDFQAGAPYSRIHIRTYFSRPGIQGHDTASAGPTNSSLCDGVKCSYCFFNSKIPSASCHNFNPGYSFSVGVDMLDFEMLVSYKVGACSSNESSSCLDSSWKNYTIPPGAPSAVRDVQARPLSSKSVEVTWTAPNQTRGTISAYTVYYKGSDGKEHHQLFSTDVYKETKVTLTGLQANTNYTIWMTASTSKEKGERSSETSVATYENECISSPCQHNGQCQVSADSYECECSENWGGKNCDRPSGSTAAAVPFSFLLSLCIVFSVFI